MHLSVSAGGIVDNEAVDEQPIHSNKSHPEQQRREKSLTYCEREQQVIAAEN